MELKDSSFCRVRFQEFLSGKRVLVNLFLRIGPDHYVKIASAGTEISMEQFTGYEEKGATYVYLLKEEFGKYVDFTLRLSSAVATSDKIELEKKARAVKHAGEMIIQNSYLEGVNREKFEESGDFLNSCVSVLSSDVNCVELFDILNTHADGLYAHSLGVSLYSLMIAKGLRWNSPSILFKIGMCGLFHDIGKKEISPEVLRKPRRQWSYDETKEFETHPIRGVKILELAPGSVGIRQRARV